MISAQTLGPLNLAGLIPLGMALLITLHLTYPRKGGADDVVRRSLTMAGWIMVLLGIFSVLLASTLILAVFTVPAAGIVAAIVVHGYRRGERMGLLWALSTAAERGIPLACAARSFSEERSDEIGLRAAELAKHLELGVPLPEALTLSHNKLPLDVQLAVSLGHQTGALGEPLRRALRMEDDSEQSLSAILSKFLYLLLVLLVAMAVVAFAVASIVPAFGMIFQEFDVELPKVTAIAMRSADFVMNYWHIPAGPVSLLATLALGGFFYWLGAVCATPSMLRTLEQPAYWLACAICLGAPAAILGACLWLFYYTPAAFLSIGIVVWPFMIATLYYMGAVRWEPPLIRRLWSRLDQSRILHCLAEGVRQQRPMPDVLRSIAHFYPKHYLRARLWKCAQRVELGEPWRECLYRQGVISSADLAVLGAAERAGNLVWALEEMSASNRRRLAFRLKSLFNVLFPFVIVAIGLVVFVYALGMMAPLVEMIVNLSVSEGGE